MTEENDAASSGGGGSVHCDTGIGDMLNIKALNLGTTAAITIPNRKNDAGLTNSSSKNNKSEQKFQIKNLKTQSIAATTSTSTAASDSEEGFLSTSPDSANGEAIQRRNRDQCSTTGSKTNLNDSTTDQNDAIAKPAPPPLFLCLNPQGCVTLRNILDCFKAPISEEQAWALLFQFVSLYRKLSTMCRHHIFNDLEIPENMDNVNVHRDGTVHCSWSEAEFKEREQKVNAQREQQHKQQAEHDEQNDDEDQDNHHHSEEHGEENHSMLVASHKKVLRQLAVIVYTALDFNLQADEQCQMSQELEDVFNYMTADESDDDCIDEGIDEGYKRWDDENDYEKYNETKEFDFVLEACKNHIKPTVPEDHYKAVCRALVTETLELRVFLQQVLANGANNVHLKAAESQTSQQELAKLGFNDWARFWVQVIDEMRRGYRLKTINHSRAPLEFELTPYEILMEDIRCKKYRLRKVMVNGDIPPRVKKDAHAIIMDFIRSRPPLKKASERKLPPPIKRQPSPREQLMDSIRQGQTLKHVQPPTPMRLKDRLLPAAASQTAASTATSTMISSTPSLLSTTDQQTATSSSSSSAALANVSGSAQTLHESLRLQQQMDMQTMPRSSKQRLIKVDFSLLQDEDSFFDNEPPMSTTSPRTAAALTAASTRCSLPKMPPYPIGGYMISEPPAQTTTIGKSMAQQQQQQQHQPVMTAAQYQYQQHQQQQTQQGMPAGLTQRVLRRTIPSHLRYNQTAWNFHPGDAYTRDQYHRFYDSALESYDLATQCESRRAALRRHTIVGCQSNFDETHSMPPSRPDSRPSSRPPSRPPSRPSSRQSDVHGGYASGNESGPSTSKQLHNTYNQYQQQLYFCQLKHVQSPRKTAGGRPTTSTPKLANQNDQSGGSSSNLRSAHSSSHPTSMGPWNKSFMDEKTWQEHGDDRLSLTLEEIVHIRSVMTKAELEGLPVGVRVKEDVEKRKVCFLCLRTRFSIFGPWGIQCKLCQRTVCSKCYTKMRIPTEHFRNVPLVLISPSLLASPAGSSTPSPSHHASHHSGHSSSASNILDESFPKTLIERLLGSESEQKARNSVGSAPSSPKHQRSNMSTPGITSAHVAPPNQAVEAIHHHDAMAASYTAGASSHSHQHVLGNGGYAKASTAQNKYFSLMSRSMEGPRSLPANSPAHSRPHSNSSTLERKSKFSRAFTLSSSGTQLSQEQKENSRGEQVPVCNDCQGLVNEITRSGKQKRSSARNRALQNLTLDLSPVWK